MDCIDYGQANMKLMKGMKRMGKTIILKVFHCKCRAELTETGGDGADPAPLAALPGVPLLLPRQAVARVAGVARPAGRHRDAAVQALLGVAALRRVCSIALLYSVVE